MAQTETKKKKGITSRACLSLSIGRPPEANKSTPIDGVEVTRITERSPSTLHGPGLRNRQAPICRGGCNWNWKFVILGQFCNVTHQSRCLSSELGNQLLRSPRVKKEKKKPVEAKSMRSTELQREGPRPEQGPYCHSLLSELPSRRHRAQCLSDSGRTSYVDGRRRVRTRIACGGLSEDVWL